MSINSIISDELTSHTIDLMRFDARTRAEVLGVLKMLEKDLVKQIEKVNVGGAIRGQTKLRRLETLLEQTRESIKSAYKKNRGILRNDLIEIAKLESENIVGTINDSLKVELATTTLSPQVARAVVKNTLIEGSPSAEWWSRQAGSLRQRFEDQMRMGITAGETNADLIRRVRGQATGKRTMVMINGKRRFISEFTGGIMDVTTSQASALVRTSVQAVANEARFETYQANDDVIKGVKALVTLDLRTSTICKARSGSSWYLDGKPIPPTTEKFPGPPPWHWSCRTTLTPITYSFEELSGKKKAKVAKMPKSTQASMDGQVPKELTYEQWLKRQPKKRQIKALGPGRYELWKQGKIKNFTELIDQTGRPLTLEQLQRKSRRRRR